MLLHRQLQPGPTLGGSSHRATHQRLANTPHDPHIQVLYIATERKHLKKGLAALMVKSLVGLAVEHAKHTVRPWGASIPSSAASSA